MARYNVETRHFELFDASGGLFRPKGSYALKVDNYVERHFVEIGGDRLNPKAFLLVERLRGKFYFRTLSEHFIYPVREDEADALKRLIADGGLTQANNFQWVDLRKVRAYSYDSEDFWTHIGSRSSVHSHKNFDLVKRLEKIWVLSKSRRDDRKLLVNPLQAAMLTGKWVTWNDTWSEELSGLSKHEQKLIEESVPWVEVKTCTLGGEGETMKINPEHVTSIDGWTITLDGPWERYRITDDSMSKLREAMGKLR